MDPASTVLDLTVAVDRTGRVVGVEKVDRVGTDVQDRHTDGSQRLIERCTQGIRSDGVASDLHIVDEQGDQGIKVPGIDGHGVVRRQLTDLFVGEKSLEVVLRQGDHPSTLGRPVRCTRDPQGRSVRSMSPAASAHGSSSVFGNGSISMRIYPHNELDAIEIVDQLCAQAALAVECGFDGVMTAEHHGGFAGYLPNPLQTTGFQLAAMTHGWAAACPLLLPLRPVAMLAEEVAWLDARFPGRVGVGVAPGSLALDFEAMDIDQTRMMTLFREGLPRLVAMLAGRELGPLAGDRALRLLDTHPIPVISAAMSPAAVRRAATAGAGVLFDGGTVIARLRELTDAYVQAGGTGARILIRRVWLGAPPEQAFENQLEVYRSYSTDAALAHWRDNGWICDEDPLRLADAIADAAIAADATCLNLRIHAPGIDPRAARAQIEALGTEVLPLVRARLASS